MISSPPASRPRATEPLSRTLQWVVWSVLGLVILALGVVAVRQQWLRTERLPDRPLPRYRTVPPFTFTERTGQPFNSAALRGKVWLADFFFTACPGPCLEMNGRLQEIQLALEKDHAHLVEIVSFSIAPEMDTPAVLTKYAQRFHAEAGRWFFLTGDRDAIYHVAHDVFLLPVLKTDPATKEADQGEYIHTTKIAVVDQSGVVRGYYDSTDPECVQRVLVDVGNLLRAKPAPPSGAGTTAGS